MPWRGMSDATVEMIIIYTDFATPNIETKLRSKQERLTHRKTHSNSRQHNNLCLAGNLGPAIATVNPDFPTRTQGGVEKCNFCEERLAKGQGPACSERCEEKAIVFGDLERPDSEVRQGLRSRFAVQQTGIGHWSFRVYIV